mmetsp:Transcript_45421/g.52263  ORF Transcript_45421/g.52263 Transcript_45421/m.52263 type:complete len:147 (+) Transcript_45421:1493-1933(+)
MKRRSRNRRYNCFPSHFHEIKMKYGTTTINFDQKSGQILDHQSSSNRKEPYIVKVTAEDESLFRELSHHFNSVETLGKWKKRRPRAKRIFETIQMKKQRRDSSFEPAEIFNLMLNTMAKHGVMDFSPWVDEFRINLVQRYSNNNGN